MEIDVYRQYRKADYTIGRLTIDGVYICDTLEDTDRGLTDEMSVGAIKKIKIKGRTAIPIGKYQVIVNWSQHFKRNMPLVCDVKGFSGIRIHSGNTDADTYGCLLCGKNTEKGKVTSSRAYTDIVYKHINAAISRKEKITITYHW